MTGNKAKFAYLELNDGGKVTLGDNTTCRVLGSGTIQISKNFCIEKVLFVDGLKHNLLSISQLCDKGFVIQFFSDRCLLSFNDIITLEGFRVNNVYKIFLDRSLIGGLLSLKSLST